MPKITVIGTTSWGIVLSILLANKGLHTILWARDLNEIKELKKQRINSLLPNQSNFPPPNLTIISEIDKAASEATLVIWAVPSQTLRWNVRQIKPFLHSSTLLMSAAKGLEVDSGKRMSEVIAEEVPLTPRTRICALSGPNLSREIAQGMPAASVVAARDEDAAKQAKELLQGHNFCIYTSDDVTGVELGGALKNIIALGAGMIDGLGLGNNAKAAFITQGWAEAVSLAVALGAKLETLYGLAGMGDLIATCSSPLSRNYLAGKELSQGHHLANLITPVRHQTIEGITTTLAARSLAIKLGIETPIINLIYRVLYESLPPQKALSQLK